MTRVSSGAWPHWIIVLFFSFTSMSSRCSMVRSYRSAFQNRKKNFVSFDVFCVHKKRVRCVDLIFCNFDRIGCCLRVHAQSMRNRDAAVNQLPNRIERSTFTRTSPRFSPRSVENRFRNFYRSGAIADHCMTIDMAISVLAATGLSKARSTRRAATGGINAKTYEHQHELVNMRN